MEEAIRGRLWLVPVVHCGCCRRVHEQVLGGCAADCRRCISSVAWAISYGFKHGRRYNENNVDLNR